MGWRKHQRKKTAQTQKKCPCLMKSRQSELEINRKGKGGLAQTPMVDKNANAKAVSFSMNVTAKFFPVYFGPFTHQLSAHLIRRTRSLKRTRFMRCVFFRLLFCDFPVYFELRRTRADSVLCPQKSVFQALRFLSSSFFLSPFPTSTSCGPTQTMFCGFPPRNCQSCTLRDKLPCSIRRLFYIFR